LSTTSSIEVRSCWNRPATFRICSRARRAAVREWDALIRAVYKRAGEAGSTRVYWLTQETNLVARGLYDTLAERSGFIVYRKNI
jgi:hypothetical protein